MLVTQLDRPRGPQHVWRGPAHAPRTGVFDRLGRIVTAAVYLSVCGFGFWLFAPGAPGGAVPSAALSAVPSAAPSAAPSAGLSASAAATQQVFSEAQKATTVVVTANFPELQGLKCGQAAERLRLLGFSLVTLLSVDAKLPYVFDSNDWSVTADGAAPHRMGDKVALDALVTVQCQWDGAGRQSLPDKPPAQAIG